MTRYDMPICKEHRKELQEAILRTQILVRDAPISIKMNRSGFSHVNHQIVYVLQDSHGGGPDV